MTDNHGRKLSIGDYVVYRDHGVCKRIHIEDKPDDYVPSMQIGRIVDFTKSSIRIELDGYQITKRYLGRDNPKHIYMTTLRKQHQVILYRKENYFFDLFKSRINMMDDMSRKVNKIFKILDEAKRNQQRK